MENLFYKLRLSVLWLFTGVAILDFSILASMELGAKQAGPEELLLSAIILLVPLVMAFLSLTLKDSTNRLANIIVGIVFAGFMLIAVVLLAQSAAYSMLMMLSGLVATVLIVWYAYKWPKG